MSTDPLPFPSVEHASAAISYADAHQASDLHFEPSEHHFEIRMRRDGLLQTVFRGERLHAPRINAQLKVLADLDIAEQRAPQDGRIHFSLAEAHNLNVRVSICSNTCRVLQHEKIATLRSAALDRLHRQIIDRAEADRVVPNE